MRQPRSTCIAAAALLAAAAMQVGCAGPALDGAIVSLDDGEATVCAPADAQGRAVFGVSSLRNVSGSEVEVSDAQLVNADGMELLGLELRPMDDADANIVGLDYAIYGPDAVALPHVLVSGESAVALVGVRVEPGASGSAEAMTLSFRGQGGDGAVETGIAMQVVPAGAVCELTG